MMMVMITSRMALMMTMIMLINTCHDGDENDGYDDFNDKWMR